MSDWNAAYEPYIDGIIKETLPHQVTAGGPVLGEHLSIPRVVSSLTSVLQRCKLVS